MSLSPYKRKTRGELNMHTILSKIISAQISCQIYISNFDVILLIFRRHRDSIYFLLHQQHYYHDENLAISIGNNKLNQPSSTKTNVISKGLVKSIIESIWFGKQNRLRLGFFTGCDKKKITWLILEKPQNCSSI